MLTWSLSPEYSYEEADEYKTQKADFQFGYTSARAYWPKPRRKISLNWNGANQLEKEAVISFFRDIGGPSQNFLYVPPDPIASPNRAGDPTQTTAGALGSRTYYFTITWVTAQGETLASPESSFAISANKVFNLTIPKFTYTTITKARIYASTTSGAEQLQAEITQSGGLWVEPTTGLIAGLALPATNTAKETLTVRLMDDMLNISKVTAVSYAIALNFQEVI